MDKLIENLISFLFVISLLLFLALMIVVVPLVIKKISYDTGTFEQLKCNELGYFKKDKK